MSMVVAPAVQTNVVSQGAPHRPPSLYVLALERPECRRTRRRLRELVKSEREELALLAQLPGEAHPLELRLRKIQALVAKRLGAEQEVREADFGLHVTGAQSWQLRMALHRLNQKAPELGIALSLTARPIAPDAMRR